MRASTRVLDAASRVLGVLPWLAGFLIAGAAGITRVSLGYWPRAFEHSPSFPLKGVVVPTTIFSAVSLVFILALALLLLLLRGVLGVRPVFNRWVLLALSGCVVVYLAVIWDPMGFVDWTFD